MTFNSREITDPFSGLELLDTPGADRLRLRFSGPFNGTMVQWDAALYTPQGWARHFDEMIPTHNIIEIGEKRQAGLALNICLKVEAIDRPTILKAVVMVRQYKRLRLGRHTFG